MLPRIRQWIISRDSNRCQHLYFRGGKLTQCFETNHLEVHHILSQRFMKKWFSDTSSDSPYNMITLCRNHHGFVHPDIAGVFNKHPHPTRKQVNSALSKRNKFVNKGSIYWVSDCDGIYYLIARRNTDKFMQEFPKSKNVKHPVTNKKKVSKSIKISK